MKTKHFARLPLDVMLDICDYLPSESVVCLVLTEKSLYQSQGLRNVWQPRMHRGRPIFTPPEDRATYSCRRENGESEMLHLRDDILNYEFLRTLELLHRDLPDHWLCDICMILHRRVAYTADGRAYPPCDESRRQGLFFRLPTWNYEFPFEYAQQIIKQCTLGAPHGSHSEIIRRDQEWETISDWPIQPLSKSKQPPLLWYRRLKVTPKIMHEDIGPVLDLWTEQHLYFPSDYIKVMESRSRDWVGDIGRSAQAHFSVCCHQHETGRDVADLLDSPLIASVSSAESKHCKACSTEYAFFVWSGTQKGSIHVALSTWITLGSCRYTFSPAWLTSSWLSSSHRWSMSSIMPRPIRPFHNDNSAFYPDSTIARAITMKRGNIIRPYKLMSHLSPSWFDEPEQISGRKPRRWAPNAIESEPGEGNVIAEMAEVIEMAQSILAPIEG
jgi:hypothetical protein